MRFLIQRVSKATVEVDEKIVGSINKGYMALIGITHTDTKTLLNFFITTYPLFFYIQEPMLFNNFFKPYESRMLYYHFIIFYSRRVWSCHSWDR